MNRKLAPTTWIDPNTELVSGSFVVTANPSGHRMESDRSCSPG
jgi:hypothetical protein